MMKPQVDFFVLVVAVALLGAGCVPVPVLAPPTKVRIGGGIGVGDVSDDRAVEGEPDDAGIFSFTAAVHPLQLLAVSGWEDLDPGIGFILESYPGPQLEGQSPLYGGFLEGGYILWDQGKGAQRLGPWRLLAVGRAELLADSGPQGDAGWGGSMGILIEAVSWVETASAEVQSNGAETSSFFGVYLGEGGIGLDISANLRDVGGQRYTALIFSLDFRVPAVAGIALIPIPVD
jgi:hypothetical protein